MFRMSYYVMLRCMNAPPSIDECRCLKSVCLNKYLYIDAEKNSTFIPDYKTASTQNVKQYSDVIELLSQYCSIKRISMYCSVFFFFNGHQVTQPTF